MLNGQTNDDKRMNIHSHISKYSLICALTSNHEKLSIQNTRGPKMYSKVINCKYNCALVKLLPKLLIQSREGIRPYCNQDIFALILQQ